MQGQYRETQSFIYDSYDPQYTNMMHLRNQAAEHSYTLHMRVNNRRSAALKGFSNLSWMPTMFQRSVQQTIMSQVNRIKQREFSRHHFDQEYYHRMQFMGRDPQDYRNLDDLTVDRLKQHYEIICDSKIKEIEEVAKNEKLTQLKGLVRSRIQQSIRTLSILTEKYLNRIERYQPSGNPSQMLQLLTSQTDQQSMKQAKLNLKTVSEIVKDVVFKMQHVVNRDDKRQMQQVDSGVKLFEHKNARFKGSFSSVQFKIQNIDNMRRGVMDATIWEEYSMLLTKCFKKGSNINIVTNKEIADIKSCHYQKFLQNFQNKHKAQPFFDFDQTAVVAEYTLNNIAMNYVLIVTRKQQYNKQQFDFWRLYVPDYNSRHDETSMHAIYLKQSILDFLNFIVKKKQKNTRIESTENMKSNQIVAPIPDTSTYFSCAASLLLFYSNNPKFNRIILPLMLSQIEQFGRKLVELFRYLALCGQDGQRGSIPDIDFIKQCTVDVFK